MSGFVFDGRSRQSHLRFASDHRPTRSSLLDDAHRRQAKRLEDSRRNVAALKIQRATRQWLSCQYVVRRAVSTLRALDNAAVSSFSTELLLEQLRHASWCLQYTRRHAQLMGSLSWQHDNDVLLPIAASTTTTSSTAGRSAGGRRQTADQVLHFCAGIILRALNHLLRPQGGLSVPLTAIPIEELRTLLSHIMEDYTQAALEQGVVEAASSTAFITLTELVRSAVSSSASEAIFCILSTVLLHAVKAFLAEPAARAALAELLAPLLSQPNILRWDQQDVLATGSAVAATTNDEGATATPDVFFAGAVCWADVCLACLTAPIAEEYEPLCTNPLAVLLSVRTVSDIDDGGAVLRSLVRGAYVSIVQQPQRLSQAHRNANWQSAAMAALGRLTRLLPAFLPGGHGAAAEGGLIRKAWMQCIGTLCEQLCQKEAFVQSILFDLHHSRAAAAAVSKPRESPLQAAAPIAGRYRHLFSHLFSSDGGLKLLEHLATTQEDGTAPLSAQNVSDADAPLTAALASSSSLEIACSVYAWPLFSFSLAGSTHRLETAAVFANLVRTPHLIRHLWRLYRDRCEGLSALLPPSQLLHNLCIKASKPDVNVRMPLWQSTPDEVLVHFNGNRAKQMAFWDPHPALSALFFTLFSYYLDVTDLVEDLKQATVLSQEECWALLFALKEVVHRSHMHGVVPGSNCEAVAHLAYLLFSKLHTINESNIFVPYASIWVSIADESTLTALVSLTPEVWEDLTGWHMAALKSLQEKVEGVEDATPTMSGDSTASSGEEEEAPRGIIGGKASSQQLPGDDLLFAGSMTWSMEERLFYVLLHSPFLIPFSQRAALLTMLLLNKQPLWHPGIPQHFTVYRGRTFVDAFERFTDQPDSVDMYSVRFASPDGVLEEGYGQGVYREFMVSACKEGLAVEHGMFRQTEDGFVFPNPFSQEATGDALHLHKIKFLGAMVGRAFRDGILQDVPFALHFRNALLGRRNSINNLKSFDNQLYRQLLSLTQLTKDDLDATGLSFTYSITSLGITREVELIKGGADVLVTPQNCLHYIHLIADYKLNREGAVQTRAFQAGLQSVISSTWLQLFDSNELLKLFGGDHSGRIDIADWRKHTVYQHPEDVESVPVRIFWEVVTSLSTAQQSKLLQFATSMNRPPLLGFRFLSPPFNVYLLPETALDRLPTSSTCFSMLKLPPYKDFATARAKIIAAIEETSSFGLT